MKKRPKHVLPVIVALCLTALLALWVRYEMTRQRAAAYEYLRSIAHTVLTAMRGTIQAEMQRGGIRRGRLETIMNGILEESDIRYLALMQGDVELVAAGTAANLSTMTETVGDSLAFGQMVCWCPATAACQTGGSGMNSGKHLGQLKNGKSQGRGSGQGNGRRNKDEAETVSPTESEIRFTGDQRFVIAFDDGGYRNQIEAAKNHLVIISVVAGLAILGLTVVWIISARGQDLKSELRLAQERDEQFKQFELAAFGLAHETRHPLGVIRASAKQIADSDAIEDDCRRRALDIVEESDVATSRLGEFMNYAKMKTATMQAVRVKPMLENLNEMLKEDFAAANICFTVEAADLTVVVDRDMLQRMVLNLVMNALQACSEGDAVAVTLDAANDGVRLTVKDSGPGIPEDIRDTVFQPYVTGRPNGHGIGLAIVHKIAMEHDWQVDLQSDAATGTTVTVSGIERSGGLHE